MRTITMDDVTSRELTPEEKGWLRQRDMHHWVETNETLFGRPVIEGESAREVGVGQQEFLTNEQVPPHRHESETELGDNYEQWKNQELLDEGAGRTPPVDFTGCTKKADYVLALRAWDMEHPVDEDDNTKE